MLEFLNWNKVLRVLRQLIELDDTGFFDLDKFCAMNGLNAQNIRGFINIGRSILMHGSEADVIRVLEANKDLLDKFKDLADQFKDNPSLLEKVRAVVSPLSGKLGV